MGLVEGLIAGTLKNGSKCDTWNDIKATHRGTEVNVILKTDDIQGILILLAIGLGASLLIFMVEILMHRSKKKKKQVFINQYVK